MKYSILKKKVTQNLDDYSSENLKRTQQAIFLHVCREGSIENLDSYFKNNISEIIEEKLIHNAIKVASFYNKSNVIEYLLESPNCQPFFNQDDYQIAFVSACSHGDDELIKYLLKSPKLDKHADVNISANINSQDPYFSGNKNGFIAALKGNQLQTVKLLIFDMNLKYSKKIKDYLHRNNNEEITKMFKAKITSDELNKSLSFNKNENIIIKSIKI